MTDTNKLSTLIRLVLWEPRPTGETARIQDVFEYSVENFGKAQSQIDRLAITKRLDDLTVEMSTVSGVWHCTTVRLAIPPRCHKRRPLLVPTPTLKFDAFAATVHEQLSWWVVALVACFGCEKQKQGVLEGAVSSSRTSDGERAVATPGTGACSRAIGPGVLAGESFATHKGIDAGGRYSSSVFSVGP